ncbi:MAG: trimeric intracellular cation channel family protein [Eubacteriaceae bacterium]|nr:trimeric intracellular cation channel family protein [Eubacteriaceae bacterium]
MGFDFDLFLSVMEWIGTVAFAVSGAVVAIRHDLDYYGIGFLAIITAVGGGIVRDVLVNRNLPASLADPSYAIVSIITAAAVILIYSKIERFNHLVSVADAVGLAAFTAIGCRVAVVTDHPGLFVVITMGVLTGTFGGVLRDVFVQQIPYCFRREVYAVASIIGAIAFYLAYRYANAGLTLAMLISFGITLVIRMYAVYNNLHLGKVKKHDRQADNA